MQNTGREVVITVKVSGNRLQSGGRIIVGTRRWEALILGCLIEAGGQGVTAGLLQTVLRRAGQAVPLDRTGLMRVFDGMERMVDTILGADAFTKRLHHAPRKRTVGPWQFVPESAEDWRVEGPTLEPESAAGRSAGLVAPRSLSGGHDGATSARPSIAKCADPRAFFRPLELIVRADALANSGGLREAADLLVAASAVDDLSPEGLGMIDLRRARLLKRGGRFEEAIELAELAARRATARGFADPGQKHLARQLARRIRYDSAPQDHDQLGPDPFLAAVTLLPDIRGLGEAENLTGLLSRRRALEAMASGRTAEAERCLRAAWNHLSAAVYWAASMRDHENLENFVFNMGLVQASLSELGDREAVVGGFCAYQVGLVIRDNFYVGKDSVWDAICIGNLWLDHPERRPEFEDVLTLEREKLSDASFFVRAYEQAKAIGEPRQVALCCVNLWRFCVEADVDSGSHAALQRLAREQLIQLLRGRQDLRATLDLDVPKTLSKMLASAVADMRSRRRP